MVTINNMVAFNLQGLWGKHRDFARAYLFECRINGFNTEFDTEFAHLVKSTRLPERSISQITTDWQGNNYKIGGTSEYTDFSITFNVDEYGNIRTEFMKWQDKIHEPENNIHGSPDEYFKDITLKHLNGIGNSIVTYKLIDAWPTSVGEISLDYSTKEIATFDVTFAYQYHKLE